MKATACILVVAASFISFSKLEAASGPSQPRNQADTTAADEVVAKYLEAIGGVETLKAIDTKRIRYRVHMFSRDGYLMERSWKRPNTMQTGRPGESTHMRTD